MISEDALKEKFLEFCEANGLVCMNVKIEECRINNHFFKENRTVWDVINDESNEDKLEIPYDDWFKADYPNVPEDLEISVELYELLDSGGYISDDSKWTVDDELLGSLEGKVYGDLSSEMQADVNSWWADVTLDDVRDNNFILRALEVSDIEEKYGLGAVMEQLGYNIRFQEPDIEDVSAAFKADLLPFWYDGVFMLALGAGGMDLSPKLDVYQALVSGSLPEDSKAFSQPDYFKYVSHMDVEKILDMCRLPEPKVTFEANIPHEQPNVEVDNV